MVNEGVSLKLTRWLYVGLNFRQSSHSNTYKPVFAQSLGTTPHEKSMIGEKTNQIMEETRFNNVYDIRSTDEIRRDVENRLRGELEQGKKARQLYDAQCRQV